MPKQCSKCKSVKNSEDFCKAKKHSLGLSSYCKACSSAYNAQRDVDGARHILRFYGITPEVYDKILEEQDHRCAACGTPVDDLGRRLAVDHDHACCPGKKSCGKCIRGLLCTGCNNGLGCFKDDPVRLRKALAYIEKYYPSSSQSPNVLNTPDPKPLRS
jgi:hypothetical protein